MSAPNQHQEYTREIARMQELTAPQFVTKRIRQLITEMDGVENHQEKVKGESFWGNLQNH